MGKSSVAIIKTSPEKVLEDIPRLMDMAVLKEALEPNTVTILKDNISEL